MRDSKYNGMFKVSPEKRIFFNAKTGETTHKAVNEKCNHDIPNESIYDMKGLLIEDAGQIAYNSNFLIRILKIKIADLKAFFNHHYDYTSDKEAFLDYLEFGILNHQGLNKGTKDFLQKLINDKRNEMNEYQNSVKGKIIQSLKDELTRNYKEWKRTLKNPLATELQFLEIEKKKG